MSQNVDHRTGQYRAELFEELVGYILEAEFSGAKIRKNVLLTDSQRRLGSVDFLVEGPSGITLVETKAPYSDRSGLSVRDALHHLVVRVEHWPSSSVVEQIIVALAGPIPANVRSSIESSAAVFASRGQRLDVWDESKIGDLLMQHFHYRPTTLSVGDMKKVVTIAREITDSQKSPDGPSPGTPPPLEDVKVLAKEGSRQNVIVLMADFCSYSKFVHASGGDDDLIASVMSRFYREARKIVLDNGGLLDKFMGDGLLAFWLLDGEEPRAVAQRFEKCVDQLAGMAVDVASSWQDEIDLLVSPTGTRCGAGLGEVRFIAENPGDAPTHAIGEAINLAARLQSAAEPNTIVISNRLKTTCFLDGEFEDHPPVEAKNIGTVKVWKKNLAKAIT